MRLLVVSFAPGVVYSARRTQNLGQAVLGSVMTLAFAMAFLALLLAGVVLLNALFAPRIPLVPSHGVVEIPAHINMQHAAADEWDVSGSDARLPDMISTVTNSAVELDAENGF